MSLRGYSLDWSDKLIRQTEGHLRDIHSSIYQYYEQEGYPTQIPQEHVAQPNLRNAPKDAEAEAGSSYKEPPLMDNDVAPKLQPQMDVVSVAGSFLLRTNVHCTPFPQLNATHGTVGVDVVVTMPTARCSHADLANGDYLTRRASFLKELEAYFKKLAKGAAMKLKATRQSARPNGEEQGGKRDDPNRACTKAETAALKRLFRMEVTRVPVRGCCDSAKEKHVLRFRFRSRPANADDPPPSLASSSPSAPSSRACAPAEPTYELFYIDLHLRCGVVSGRVMSAVGIRKHPYYSHLVLEDYLMPHYLRKLHTLCVSCGGLRRAIVLLKCWAYHMGLMASASGHPEGLNGFVLSAMVLHLLDEGILSPNMTEESVARTVWVRIVHGHFISPSAAVAVKPSTEEHGDVAVLRLRGEVMNLLFRTSTEFFKSVVQRAAEDALLHPSAFDVLAKHPFQPLQLRHDVALVVREGRAGGSSAEDGGAKFDPSYRIGDPEHEGEHNLGVDGDTAQAKVNDSIKKPSVYFSLHTERANAVRDVLRKALAHRARHVLVWNTAPGELHVAVRLADGSESRSHLTRGPPIEDVEAVAAFNAFWGMDITSTRQFPDGGIYRCVLWRLGEGSLASAIPASIRVTTTLPASVVLRHVVQYALRRHMQLEGMVFELLGGLEGFLSERIGAEWCDALPLMQGTLRQASQDVQRIIAEIPKGALPCKVIDFTFVAASERSTEVFPVRPHLALTYTTDHQLSPSADNGSADSASGYGDTYVGISTTPSIEPICAVLSIDDKGKIPDTLEAIDMMRGAICAQLAKFFNQRFHNRPFSTSAKDAPLDDSASLAGKSPKGFRGEPTLRPSVLAFATRQSVDVINRGYFFRIFVAHYREVSLLRSLQRDAEASALEQKFFWAPQHSKFISSVVYGHTSYAKATRLAKRWLSAMLLYEFILPEAVELLVAHAYLSEGAYSVPKTPAAGFLRFIQLLATHDWSTPLILPFTDESKTAAAAADLVRKLEPHQAMYIATPYAPTLSPFTLNTPRHMIVHRLVQLAHGALALLTSRLLCDSNRSCSTQDIEAEVFHASPLPFDFCVQLHPQLILYPDRALYQEHDKLARCAAPAEGGEVPKAPVNDNRSSNTPNTAVRRIWMLDELKDVEQMRRYVSALVGREPAARAVQSMRAVLRDQAMVFYDVLAPLYVYVVGITETHVLKHSQALHNAVMRVCRGGLLPVPAAFAFNRADDARESTRATALGSSTDTSTKIRVRPKRDRALKQQQEDGEYEAKEEEEKLQHGKKHLLRHDTTQRTGRTENKKRLRSHLQQDDQPTRLEAERCEAADSAGPLSSTSPTAQKQAIVSKSLGHSSREGNLQKQNVKYLKTRKGGSGGAKLGKQVNKIK